MKRNSARVTYAAHSGYAAEQELHALARTYSLWPLHSLRVPSKVHAAKLAEETGTIVLFPPEFDLVRRPFWVWNRILEGQLSGG